MRIRILIISILGTAALALGTAATLHAAGDHEGGHGGDFAFGQAAEGNEPDRSIEITASDSMDFDPERIEVEAGEVVRFVVRNTGSLHHSFTLGSNEWHQHHEEEMKGMATDEMAGHMRHEPNGVVVAPGETAELTWQFEGGGEVELACHVPGHYAAGMEGLININ